MKLKLAWRYIRRGWLRSLMLTGGLAVFVFVFTAMAGVLDVMSGGQKEEASRRLVVAEKDSGAWKSFPPTRYAGEIEEMPGVKAVSGFNLTGTDPLEPNFLMGRAVDDDYVEVNPELQDPSMLKPEAWRRLKETRRGVIVGDRLAEKFGWSKGDNIRLTQWSNWPDLNLEIVGIIHHPEYRESYLINQDFLQESVPWLLAGVSQWILVMVEPSADKAEVTERIESHFAARPVKVEVTGEGQFLENFEAMVGDVKTALAGLIGAALVAGFLTTLTPVSISFRERMRTLAVLRSIGFRWPSLLSFLGLEVAALTLTAGVLGAGGAYLVFKAAGVMIPAGPVLVPLSISPSIAVVGALSSVLIGVLAAVLPATRAMRMNIAAVLTRID